MSLYDPDKEVIDAPTRTGVYWKEDFKFCGICGSELVRREQPSDNFNRVTGQRGSSTNNVECKTYGQSHDSWRIYPKRALV